MCFSALSAAAFLRLFFILLFYWCTHAHPSRPSILIDVPIFFKFSFCIPLKTSFQLKKNGIGSVQMCFVYTCVVLTCKVFTLYFGNPRVSTTDRFSTCFCPPTFLCHKKEAYERNYLKTSSAFLLIDFEDNVLDRLKIYSYTFV